MLTQKPLIPVVLTLCACLCLSACGSGSHKASQPTRSAQRTAPQATQAAATSTTSKLAPLPSAGSPQKVLAVVGGKPIRMAEVLHLLALRGARMPLPDPPSYSGCIARVKAAASKENASEAQKAEAKKSSSQLKQSCAQEYQKLFGLSLSAAIHNRWLAGEAADQGLSVSAHEVQQELDLSKKSFKTQAEFDAYLKGSGEGIADVKDNIKLGKVADKIFAEIKGKEHPATPADVARFYAAHRQQFAIPQGRVVRIVRTTTEAAVLNVKRELSSGKSFAQVAKELSAIGQPITSKHGEVADLKPHTFLEKNLDHAIFSAKLHRLYGPVSVKNSRPIIAPEAGTGFYVFEVTGIVPGGQTPLSSVKAQIAEELTKANREKVLKSAIAAFHRKWTSRTDCKAGYVVENCRQFKIAVSARDDPFTL